MSPWTLTLRLFALAAILVVAIGVGAWPLASADEPTMSDVGEPPLEWLQRPAADEDGRHVGCRRRAATSTG